MHIPAGVLLAKDDPALRADHFLHPCPGAQWIHQGWVSVARQGKTPDGVMFSSILLRQQSAGIAVVLNRFLSY